MIQFYILVAIVAVTNGQRCGNSQQSVRIVGGTEAKRLQYPWQSLMFVDYITSQNRRMMEKCGATLIDDQWIVTAAHCFDAPEDSSILGVRIIAGEHNTDERNNPYRVQMRGAKITIHGKYNPDTMDNDIAMVKLNQKLDYNGKHKYLQPICLPVKDIAVNGDNCFASGWGKTSNDGPDSHILRHVNLPMLNATTCRQVWGSYMNDNKFCAGVMTGGKDSCQGDSGGPLQCPLANGVFVLQGVTSFGAECGKAGAPGVYTRVVNYLDWINKVKTAQAG